ncbi:phage holin family protein [Lederbergia sp. NSJ-179]|uniref:phage holin family protein n=1 Tax=Lederbergia sp. NSJ-179 TaxID=2931402 RepID=UPI002455D9B6|nr:phage holin family protein [Lederbergia sp. NSJ-179]
MEVFIIEKIILICSFLLSSISFLIGTWHISLTVLAVFMAIDIITGIFKGIVTKKMDSKVGYRGFIRKAGIMLVIIIANLLDLLTGAEFLFRSMAVLFYIGLESLSIIENLGHIGVPLPQQIKKYLKQLSEEGKDKNNE